MKRKTAQYLCSRLVEHNHCITDLCRVFGTEGCLFIVPDGSFYDDHNFFYNGNEA